MFLHLHITGEIAEHNLWKTKSKRDKRLTRARKHVHGERVHRQSQSHLLILSSAPFETRLHRRGPRIVGAIGAEQSVDHSARASRHRHVLPLLGHFSMASQHQRITLLHCVLLAPSTRIQLYCQLITTTTTKTRIIIIIIKISNN